MTNNTNNIKNLKVGNKYTFINTSDLLPYVVQGELKGYYIDHFAQYHNSINLFIKIKGSRATTNLYHMTITPADTVVILNSDSKELKQCWRREKVTSTETRLHRLDVTDFTPEQIAYTHKYLEQIEGNSHLETFETILDLTGDFLYHNNIKPKQAEQNSYYINYIKELIIKYNLNVTDFKQWVKTQHFNILVNCVNLAIEYNW